MGRMIKPIVRDMHWLAQLSFNRDKNYESLGNRGENNIWVMTSVWGVWCSLLGITQVEVSDAGFVEARSPGPAPLFFSPFSPSNGDSNSTYRGSYKPNDKDSIMFASTPPGITQSSYVPWIESCVLPQNSYLEALIPNVMAFWKRWDLWKLVRFRFGHKGRAPWWN